MMKNAYESSYNIDQHSVRPHLELSFRTVFALPNASKRGLDWWREQVKNINITLSSAIATENAYSAKI